jgi:hypothetical protein
MHQFKIGIITPTYNRPDFARLLALQMQNQRVHPHILCFHQNGTNESYEWAITDINCKFAIKWIHTPEKIPQEEWYATPLEYLINERCTHFFWCDHDDFYGDFHLSNGITLLLQDEYDFQVNERSNKLLLKPKCYEYIYNTRFTAHDPGGMSSSMCFNRKFAIELLKDLRANKCKTRIVAPNEFTLNETDKLYYADQVVRRVTMPKFRCLLNQEESTTTYVCHPGSSSSSSWLT